MPIFEFKCNKCENEFETILFRSDDTVKCPDCGSEKVIKLLSTCSFKSSSSTGEVTSSAGSSACSSCSSGNCSTCH